MRSHCTALMFALAGLLPVVPATGDDEPKSVLPVHQVLDEKPADLMLQYYQGLAATLPEDHAPPISLEGWKQRRVKLREQLWSSLGQFPLDDRPSLNAKVTGRIDHGDHVVEKILYESLPGLYVTALAYVPKQIEGRVPAVICVNGHWAEAKTTKIIQQRCMGLARMGVIAFCQDIIGTGERQAYDGSPPQTYHGFYRGAVPRITDRSILGYVMYECLRSLDYLISREDVDPDRVMCTGASGGGLQSLYFPALDERLAGGVPVCYVSSYQAHMGAVACVCEVPTGILRYSNQWEVLGLHAPRPLLCIAASRDVPVFQPRHVYESLEKTKQIYRLYGAEDRVQAAEVDSGHDYNLEMRELLYQHVAKHLLGENREVREPDDLPVESDARLRVGLPTQSETMQSLTYRRAREMAAAIPTPTDRADWDRQQTEMCERLRNDILGGFPEAEECTSQIVRTVAHNDYRLEQWTLQPEPGIVLPCVLCLPPDESTDERRPAVLIVDEQGKGQAFDRGLVDTLVKAGNIVLAVDVRGTGETAGTAPDIAYGPGTPDYNLSNYALFVGRPLMGMRVFDIRCATDFLAARPEVDANRLTICGRGREAFAGVLAAAFDERISAVVAEEMLSSWVFPGEFVDIGLSYLIPRILTVGDVPHLVSLVSPRPVLLLNSVDARRRPIGDRPATVTDAFANRVYELHAGAGQLQRQSVTADESIQSIVKWLEDVFP